MPVTFFVTPHPAEPVNYVSTRVRDSVETLFTSSREASATQFANMLSTSVEMGDLKRVLPVKNGFVSMCIEAYSKQHHLTLRPDDIWLTMLSQLNVYVNARAEELRASFVAHDGQKDLVLIFPDPKITRHTVDASVMADGFTQLLRRNVVDDEPYDFVMPDFTTTGAVDQTACCIMMMSTLKRYFRYIALFGCGLPSVTLLGEKCDYESIERRLSKLAKFGAETRRWVDMLRPVLRRFIRAFDGEVDVDFWQRIFTETGNASAPHYYSGWITAFCPFDNRGTWQLSEIRDQPPPEVVKGYEARKEHYERRGKTIMDVYPPALVLDGVAYGSMPTSISVVTHCQVDVEFIEMTEGMKKYSLGLVAGLVGATVSSVSGGKNNALAPYPAWFLYEKKEGDPHGETDVWRRNI